MPTGKVKWYDAQKGFGFLSRPDGDDVYVHADALPDGVTSLKTGTRVEFDLVQGRRGDQALHVRLVDPIPSVSKAQAQARRKSPEDMVVIVEDLMKLLDGLGESYRRGRHPESRQVKPVAQLMRALADELD